jgi:hypothetical protein
MSQIASSPTGYVYDHADRIESAVVQPADYGATACDQK